MFSFSSNVRFSECDETGHLSLTGLVDYFQDCSVFHTQSTSRTMEALTADGLAWLLAGWHIDIESLPYLGDGILINTWEYACKGLFAHRNFALTSPEGEPYACADARWFLMDFNAGRPIRVPRNEIEEYEEGEVPLDIASAPRHLNAPEGGRQLEPITVTEHLLDTNHHVNNARYVELAYTVAQPKGVKGIDVVYKQAATLGDVMVPRVVDADDGIYVSLTSPDGTENCTVKFS